MDGFDKGAGKMTEETWMKVVEIVKRELALKEGDYLLEVGCGAGAMLLPLSELGIRVAGVDFSSSLIKVGSIPDLIAHVGEACELPFGSKEFDAVLSHSVFHYFPDYEYTERALLEMLRVSKEDGKILIMDIPDFSKKEISEKHRRGVLLEEE